MSQLSQQEASSVFAAILPNYRPDANGKCRCAASYRNGDNDSALSIDATHGGRFFDHVTGTGGDCVDLVKTVLNTDFRGACKVIADVTGRNLLKQSEPKRAPTSNEMLAKARRFRIGVLWRIDRDLAVLKDELFGQKHEEAAAGVRDLTRWRSEVEKWSDHQTAGAMNRLMRQRATLVDQAIQEAAESERTLAQAVANTLPLISKDAHAA